MNEKEPLWERLKRMADAVPEEELRAFHEGKRREAEDVLYHEKPTRMKERAKTDPYWRAVKVLPTDYDDYGGQVKRFEKWDGVYGDCSGGCRWFAPLEDEPLDWGVCLSPCGPRSGLLTWEHQAGYECFELDPEDVEDEGKVYE